MSRDPLRVTYEIRARDAAAARETALAIAREQTLECVPGLAPKALERRLLGRVGRSRAAGAGVYAVPVSYAAELVAGSFGSLLNLVYGNVSMMRGIRLADVAWPRSLLDAFPGPAYGLEGVRALTGVRGRALLCAILKPVGLSSAALARQARRLAEAGVDVIKDDHNLADQISAPFATRVARVQEAIAAANAKTGRRCLYLPHLHGGGALLAERVELLHAAECRGALVAPCVLGWETLAALAAESGLILLAHPTTSGVFLAPGHGIARDVLYGQLLRLAGADGVIFPNARGRFPSTEAECRAIAARLRAPLGDLRPAFPAPGGGMDLARVRRWRALYGAETLFLLGSGLLRERDLTRAVAELLQAVGGA